MPRDVLKSGLAWLTAQLREHASQEITYSRDGDSVTLRGTFNQELLRLDDGFGGIRMEWTELDIGVTAADLVLGGRVVEPERGDVVRIALPGGTTLIYEVAPIGSDPAWRYTDPYRLGALVRCKFMETEEPC